MQKKTLELILKTGILLSFISFFIIANGWYYPYITGKQIYFNILIEILAWFWFYLILQYPDSRPRRSWLTWSLLIWLAVLLASAVGGVDFNLSFWGDTERMLGWFSLLHFFVFYLIIITVFKTKNDWLGLLNGSVAAAVLVAIYAFTSQSRAGIGNVNMMSNISTLGNATYVAGVMLFNLYFLIYLWFNTRHALLKLWYLIAAGFIGAAFYYANVSGSQAALVVSLLLFGLLLGILHTNKRVKTASLTVVGAAVMVMILSAVLAFQRAPLFDNKLGAMIRDFSAANTSLNARFFAWRAGWRGFQERPILGWGYGNFSAPFDKFFQAGLYAWTPQEEYYDRAHNMPIEMLATAGALGLLAYLAIFAAVGVGLLRAWRRQSVKPLSVAVLAGVFTAYFIHNLAVFDSLANLVCWMLALAWAVWLTNNEAAAESATVITVKHVSLNLMVFGLLIAAVLYYGNLRPAQMLAATVDLARSWYTEAPSEMLAAYQKTFSYQTPLDRDARTFFSGLVLEAPNRLAGAGDRELGQFFSSVITLNQANVALNPNDYFLLYRQAQLLNLIGGLTNNQATLQQALAMADRAIASGGEHLPARLTAANIYLDLKNYQQAAATLRRVLAIWPPYSGIYCQLAYLELNYNLPTDAAALWSNWDNCLDEGNTKALIKGDYLLTAAAHYQALPDETRLKKLQALMLAK